MIYGTAPAQLPSEKEAPPPVPPAQVPLKPLPLVTLPWSLAELEVPTPSVVDVWPPAEPVA